MASQRDTHLENIQRIRTEVLAVLDGMDYCLDWKPDAESWSAREVVYHLVDTPSGGVGLLVSGILSGQVAEFEVVPDRHNMTPERQTRDIALVVQDVTAVLDGLETAVSNASEDAIAGTSALAHLPARGVDEVRTPQMLLEGLFARHWRGHLEQLRELRETLGV